jgi:hypothetical protein
MQWANEMSKLNGGFIQGVSELAEFVSLGAIVVPKAR